MNDGKEEEEEREGKCMRGLFFTASFERERSKKKNVEEEEED